MLGKAVRHRFYAWPIVLAIGVGFALANGLGWACGNLRQYLLHGLHALDPSFLAGDWFTTQTKAHHAVFNTLLVAAGHVGRLDWAFVLLNAVFAAVFAACVYAIAVKHYRYPLLVCAIAVYLFHFAKGGMLGWSCILSFYFQPSTIGAVCLLVGLACLIHRRWNAAGWTLFLGALFHVNYMVWIVAIAGAVTLLNLRRLQIRHAISVIAPIGLAVCFHLPFIAEGRSAEQLAVSAQASRILHDIYMPCHSRPLTWGAKPFVQFGAMMVAGVIALHWQRPRLAADPIARSILAVLAAIFIFGTLFTIVVAIDTVALLFPYRLVPFMLLAAEIAVSGALVHSALRPRMRTPATLLIWMVLGGLLGIGGVNRYVLTCLATLIVVAYTVGLIRSRTVSPALAIGTLCVCALGLTLLGAGKTSLIVAIGCIAAAGIARLPWDSLNMIRRGRAILAPATIAVPIVIAAFLMRVGAERKDFMGPAPEPDEQLLYAWCRDNTPAGERFIVPPVCGGFRLGTGRAIVIDWKCMPILPRDTVEWYRRLVDVCGVTFDDLAGASQGYFRMTARRAADVATKYDAHYLVTFNQHHSGDLSPLPRLYRNDTFSVYAIEPQHIAMSAD